MSEVAATSGLDAA